MMPPAAPSEVASVMRIKSFVQSVFVIVLTLAIYYGTVRQRKKAVSVGNFLPSDTVQ